MRRTQDTRDAGGGLHGTCSLDRNCIKKQAVHKPRLELRRLKIKKSSPQTPTLLFFILNNLISSVCECEHVM